MRLASTQELSGCTDQAIEAKVSAARAANSSSVTPPQARPGAPITITAAAAAAASSAAAISIQVFGPRSVPPVVTNATSTNSAARPHPKAASELMEGQRAGLWPLASSGPDAARLGAGAIDDTAASVSAAFGDLPGFTVGDQHQSVTEQRRAGPGPERVQRLQ